MRTTPLLVGVFLLCVGGGVTLHAQGSPTSGADTGLSENTRIAHAVTFLSSLAEYADFIASANGEDASGLRSAALTFIHDAKGVRTAQEEEIFLERIHDAFEEIFEGGPRTFGLFRLQTAATLKEITDALPLLVPRQENVLPIAPSPTERITQRTRDLVLELQYIEDPIDLLLWLHAYRPVAEELRLLIPSPDLATAKDDLSSLLGKLRAYMTTVEASDVTIVPREEDITALEQRIRNLQDEGGVAPIVRDIEILLASLTENIPPASPTP